MIFTLTPDDDRHAWQLAKCRVDITKKFGTPDRAYVRKNPGYDPYMLHLRGLRAEFAVARFLGVEPPAGVNPFGDDHGPDLHWLGRSIEVKYSHSRSRSRHFALARKEHFLSDLGVLVIQGPQWERVKGQVDIIGYISRLEFLDACVVLNLGYGLCYGVPARDLHPIEQLKESTRV